MKRIVKVFGACLMCLMLVCAVSCGKKVDTKELNQKIEQAIQKGQTPDLTDAEYEYMVDYLLDNFDELNKLGFDDPESDTVLKYIMTLAMAQGENKLSEGVSKKFDELQKKASEAAGVYEEDFVSEEELVEELPAEVEAPADSVAVVVE